MSRSCARLTRKNSHFPPALRSVQGSRLAQSALTEKCDFRWRELNFIWVQRHAAACAALRAEQSFHSKCAHRKVRFSVAGNHTIVFLRRAALLLTVQQHYIKRKSTLSRLSELLLFRRRHFTLSTSTSTSTSSFTSSSTSTWRRRRGVGERKRVEHNVSRA